MELLEKTWKRGKEFLGVKYPIICGGMTWVSNFALVKTRLKLVDYRLS